MFHSYLCRVLSLLIITVTTILFLNISSYAQEQDQDIDRQIQRLSIKQLSYDALLQNYIHEFPELIENTMFLVNFGQHYFCEDWKEVLRNEFKYEPFIKQLQFSLIQKTTNEEPIKYFVKRIVVPFGKYDSDKKQFNFKPLLGDSYDKYPLKIGSKTFSESDNHRRNFNLRSYISEDCLPMDKNWPAKFKVQVTNPDLIIGLPMAPETGNALLESRKSLPLEQQRMVGLNLMLKITKWDVPYRPKNAMYRGHYESLMQAEIVDAYLDDGLEQFSMIPAEFDKKYWEQGRERVEKRRIAQAEDKRARELAAQKAPLAFTRENAVAWYRKLQNNTTSKSEDNSENTISSSLNPLLIHTKLGLLYNPYTGQGSITPILDKHTTYSTGNGYNKIILKFTNTGDFSGKIGVPSLRRKTKKTGEKSKYKIDLLVLPVGSFEDKYFGGKVIMGHISHILIHDLNGAQPKKIGSKTHPEPYKHRKDSRSAREIDFIGIHGGMALKAVQNIAKRELEHEFVFDKDTKTLRSDTQKCQVFFRSKLPLYKINNLKPGDICLEGEFIISGKSFFGKPEYNLGRLVITQALKGLQKDTFKNALIQKYGMTYIDIEISRIPPSPRTITSDNTSSILNWGKVLSDNRMGMETIRNYPVTALEAEIFTSNTKTVAKITLTDSFKIQQIEKIERHKKAEKQQEKTQPRL